MTEKKSFIVYFDYLESLNLMSDEDAGKLFKAMVIYAKTKEMPVLTPVLSMAFSFIKPRIDSDSEKWEETRKARAESGSAGGKKKSQSYHANVANLANATFASKPSKCYQNVANVADMMCYESEVLCHEDECNKGTEEEKETHISPIPESVTGKKEIKAGQKKEPDEDKKKIDEKFDVFWSEYPRKTSKLDSKKAFERIDPDDELFNKIMAALKRFKFTEDWERESGKFIPYPASWLNKARWEDEIVTPASRYNFELH